MRFVSLLAALLLTGNSGAEELAVSWEKRDDGRTTVHPDNTIEIRGTEERTTTTVLVLPKRKVPSHQYKLAGRIKFAGVVGDGYVEMLNLFPGRGEYFTRTLGEGGSMGKLNGTSDWRDLELPFMSEPGLLPEKLTVNVVLPGQGTVWLRPLRLEAFDGNIGMNWMGPIFGVLVGTLGALVGTLAPFQRTRKAASLLAGLSALLSVILLTLGIAALVLGREYGAWFPLVLAGGIGAVVFPGVLFSIRKRQADDEQRRMQALDA